MEIRPGSRLFLGEIAKPNKVRRLSRTGGCVTASALAVDGLIGEGAYDELHAPAAWGSSFSTSSPSIAAATNVPPRRVSAATTVVLCRP